MKLYLFLVTSILLVWPSKASAQRVPVQGLYAEPSIEVGASIGDLWWPGENEAGSARITVNHGRVLATEVALLRLDNRFLDDVPTKRALMVTARLMEPPSARPWRAFVAAGAAVGQGYRDGVSPVVSVGVQNNWRVPIGVRVETQRFLRATTPQTRSRFLIGVSVALGSR